ncbi:MAG: hypothetical protein QG670_259 [Thermoproteota archaeon]|nr:hypothetical protein [Thermoproteota archaeon]
MPSCILSHQGFVLPLKSKYPELFDGIALCIGSFAPDIGILISYFFKFNFNISNLFHSIGGLIYVIPISLLLIVIFNKALLPALASLILKRPDWPLNNWFAFLVVDEYRAQKKMKLSANWLKKATYSVFIGVFSHFLLDLPTHSQIPYLSPFYYGIMPKWFLEGGSDLKIPFYGNFRVTVNCNLLWITFSIGLAILALYNLRYIAKQRLKQRLHPIRSETIATTS